MKNLYDSTKHSRLVYTTSSKPGYSPRQFSNYATPLTAFQTEVVKANQKRARLSSFIKSLSE